MAMKIIFCPTIPHTGTWFLVDFLKEMVEVENFIQLQALRKNETFLRDPVSGQAGLVHGVVNLLQGHFTPQHAQLIMAFAAQCPTIIPLRDPLAALVTRQHRHPELSHVHIVNGFVELASKIDLHRDSFNPLYVPWDMFHATDDRVMALTDIVEHAGLSYDKNAETIGDWAASWPIAEHNSQGVYPLKRAYKDGDWPALRAELAPEIQVLQQAEHIIRPMLERVGYRNLLWWRDRRRQAA